MRLKRTTWLLLATAIAFGGFVYFSEIRGASQRQTVQEQKQQVFGFPEEQIERFSVDRDGEIIEFERTENPKQPWQMKRPESKPASEAAISFLLNQVAKSKRDRNFPIARSKLAEYGLDEPAASVTLFLKGQPQPHTLLLGKSSFDEKFVYALIDPSPTTQALSVTLVPIDFKYAVERKLPEWKE